MVVIEEVYIGGLGVAEGVVVFVSVECRSPGFGGVFFCVVFRPSIRLCGRTCNTETVD